MCSWKNNKEIGGEKKNVCQCVCNVETVTIQTIKLILLNVVKQDHKIISR